MKRYDVCLSFAGEDRVYVDRVADELRRRKVRVFYDRYERSELWGKNLYTHLDEIYQNSARFCVMFISEHYAAKRWPSHERESAQARAFTEPAEYILPARFDDTPIPGLRPTVAHVDLRDVEPEELADVICLKLQSALFETNGSGTRPGFSWFADRELVIGGEATLVRAFQYVPIRYGDESLNGAILNIVSRMLDAVHRSDDGVFWTSGPDRRFDRIYTTSSVLYAMCQLGVSHDLPLIRQSIAYLKRIVTPSVDDRAGVIFLMLINELSAEVLAEFLHNLRLVQHVNTEDQSLRGSFLLPQGPTPEPGSPPDNWTADKLHYDGRSFHACHLADALLHIPGQYADCRAAAEPILDGIREFLVNAFMANDGWLRSLNGDRTPLTLYGYALCSALHIPLPAQWRAIGLECNRIASDPSGGVLKRFHGVMNASYAGRSIDEIDFSREMTRFVTSQLATLPSDAELDRMAVRDLAALLRSLAYGVQWLDMQLMSSMRVAITGVVQSWSEEGFQE